jgi:DNA-directed RNA polymerase subunit RPC12/RpoP
MPDTGETRFHCPGCNEEVEVAPETVGNLVRCPYCNTDFFASPEHLHQPVVDDTASELAELDRQAAFDKLRIENFTALRMGAIRARSWWMIAMCLALLTALDMIGRAVIYVTVFRSWGVEPILRAVVAGSMLTFAKHARKRAADFKREIEQSAIPEPATPPDFSTLSDGVDRWKDLENVR